MTKFSNTAQQLLPGAFLPEIRESSDIDVPTFSPQKQTAENAHNGNNQCSNTGHRWKTNTLLPTHSTYNVCL